MLTTTGAMRTNNTYTLFTPCPTQPLEKKRSRISAPATPSQPSQGKNTRTLSGGGCLDLSPTSVHQDRVPYPTRHPSTCQQDNPDGLIVASDEAYIDTVLNLRLDSDAKRTIAQNVVLENFVDRSHNVKTKALGLIHKHRLRYKQQIIWEFTTMSECDGRATWGESSSCRYFPRTGQVRVKIHHKGKNFVGRGWNSEEERIYDVQDLIRLAGLEAMKQMMQA